MQLIGDAEAGPRPRTGLTPAETGSIVGAHPGHLGHLGLHLDPVQRGAGKPRLQDDGGTALAGAAEMQPVTPTSMRLPGGG